MTALSRLKINLRAALDALYLWAGHAAAAAMLGILLLTVLQISARLTGYGIRGATDYAGYCMAASAFLAFAHALNHGAHIRIEVFLQFMGRRRVWGEKLSLAVSCAIALWLAWHSWDMVYWSWKFNDISQGPDATPLWIPQATMALGASLFAIAMIDHTARLFATGDHGILPSSGPAE